MTEKQPNNKSPWSLHFDRDGTEDVAIICDSDGEDLARSRPFWLPNDDDDPVPPTLTAMRLMVAAPILLAALMIVAERLGVLIEAEEETAADLEAYEMAWIAIAEATGRTA